MLTTTGTNIYVGSISEVDKLSRLYMPPPRADVPHLGLRFAAFASPTRLYAVAARGRGGEVLAWDLSRAEGPAQLTHREAWTEGGIPTGLSIAPQGDLLAIGLSGGQVRLLGSERLRPWSE